MTIIKNIGKLHSRKVVSVKNSVKEKWEQIKKCIAEKLNSRSKHWQTRHKKRFLTVFCIGFIVLLLLSIFKFHIVRPVGKVITVPALSHNILAPEITTPRAFLPGDTLPWLPTGLDTMFLDNGQTVNYSF